MPRLGDGGDVAATRLVAQLLAGDPASTVEAVVRRVLSIQAQDARGFRLSVRSRSRGLFASDVDRALTETRSLVVTWLNRGTLHLVAADDYWWLHPLTAPQVATTNARRLRQEGVSATQAERGVAIVADAVSEGPQTRQQLGRRLEKAGIPTAGQALVHVLIAASLRGDVVRGPMVGAQHAYVSVTAWLGAAPPALDRHAALGRLARRYLCGHGPASAQDLAKWAGIPLRDARRGLDVIAEELTELGDGLVVVTGTGDVASPQSPRLLGPFDPLLHGWVSREPFVGPHAGVVTVNGIFRPVALVRGRVVAIWALPGGVISITPLQRLPKRTLDALRDDASDVYRFLGLPERAAVVE